MKHHCGCLIEIHTDPRRTEYKIIQGIRKKVRISHFVSKV